MIHYPRDKTAKLVIRFEVRSFLSRGYFLKSATSLFRPSCMVPRVTGLTRVYCRSTFEVLCCKIRGLYMPMLMVDLARGLRA